MHFPFLFLRYILILALVFTPHPHSSVKANLNRMLYLEEGLDWLAASEVAEGSKPVQ
jgi:hypothetical protein